MGGRAEGANPFTQGPILKPLLRFTLPILCAMFLQSAYGAVDVLVVGLFATSADMAAVGTCSILMTGITNFVTGLSTGMAVMLANRVGAKAFDLVGRGIGSSICLFSVVAVLFTGGLLALVPALSRLMQVPEESLIPFSHYMSICACGMVFIVGYDVISAVFRGIGNSRLPLLFVGIACAVNVVGDLILIAGFGMGAAGAAIATVFAQGVSAMLSLVIIRRQELPFKVVREQVRFCREDISRILSLGLPIGVQNSLTTVSFMFLVSVINGLGSLVMSAAYSAGMKVSMFISLPLKSSASSLSTFVAQNMGARRPDRAKKALLYGGVVCFLVGAALCGISWLCAEPLAGVFNRDAAIIAAAASFIAGWGFDNFPGSIVFCFTGYFNGHGRTRYVMLQAIIAGFAVRVPLSFALGQMPGVTLFRFALVGAAGSLAGLLFYLGCYIKMEREQKPAAAP